MNVLSLFDGMSCGQIALERAGFKVDNYYASEIDKHAIKVTMVNFPNTIQLGSVVDVKGADLPKIDLIIGGSPCQGFSFAGKQLNFNDERSKLFFEYLRLIKECNPTYFILENVKMKPEYERVITGLLGVRPIRLNSNFVSAQERKRLYWTNIPVNTIPANKNIFLKDILESDVDEKYYVIKDGINYDFAEQFIVDFGYKNEGLRYYSDKSPTLQSRDYKEPKCVVNKKKVLQLSSSTESGGKQPYQQNRVYGINGLSPALMAEISSGTHHILEDKTMGVAIRGRYNEDGTTSQTVEVNNINKSNSITTVQKDSLVLTGNRIRKLTPVECERLQTVPDKELVCIFEVCLDQIKNYVSVVEQNPKLLKLALSAEKNELSEFVNLVTANISQSNQQIKHTVLQNVDTQTQMPIEKCTGDNPKENNTTADNVENTVMCKNQNQEGDSVAVNAFINITEGRITHFGKEELHLKDNHSTIQINGGKQLKLFGNEIMGLVKYVDAGMKKNNEKSFTSTTLSVLSINSLEQMLATFYLFVKSATTGYTQGTTSKKNLLVQFKINDGYTSCVSDTQRYKMLGNGWTVDIIVHILKHMKL